MGDDILLIYLIIGIILIFVVLGILTWAIVSMLKKDQGKDEKPDKSKKAVPSEKAAEKSTSFPSADQKAQSTSESKNKDPELLRVFRNINTGAIYIEIDGKQYHQLTDIHDPKTGRLLLQSVADLGRFTRGVTPAVPTKTTAPPAEQAPRNASLLQPQKDQTQERPQQAQQVPEPGSLAKRGEALINSSQAPKVEPGTIPPPASGLLERAYKISESTTTSSKPPVPEIKRPEPSLTNKKPEQKISMGAFWGRVLSSSGSESIGPRPLADELEDILQDIMDNAPEEIPKDIHFRTAADGRLIIEVEGASYQDVGEVQDPVAKQVIQAVIKKWEKK